MQNFSFSNSHTSSTPITDKHPFSLSVAQRQYILKRNYVQVIGSNANPTMMLCNGFGCHQRIWHYLTTALAARYRLVLFDHVGSGQSELAAYKPEKYTTLSAYAQDVVEICQALDIERAILVGHSVGATIAMLAAIQAPGHFEKTILLAPSPYYINESDYYGGFEREDLLQVLAAMAEDYQGWTSSFAGLLLGPRSNASLGEELTSFFCETDSAIAQQFARITFLSDNRADVPKLKLPTLLVQCTDDVAGPPEVGEYLLKHMPQAQLVTLRATGHCPHLSAPLETLAVMNNFLISAN